MMRMARRRPSSLDHEDFPTPYGEYNSNQEVTGDSSQTLIGTPIFQLGIIADCQHADKPARGARTYRESLDRLALAVEHLNTFDLYAVLHLGDAIDGRDTLDDSVHDLHNVLASLQMLRPQLQERVLHAIGNHDLAVTRPQLALALELANGSTFYSKAVRNHPGWRLIVLDTFHITRSWVDQGRQPPSAEASKWLEEHADRPNAVEWNGAVGQVQQQWLSSELAAATSAGERVLVFGHAPLIPEASDATHCAWDGEETAAVLGTLYAQSSPTWLSLHRVIGLAAFKHSLLYFSLARANAAMPDKHVCVEAYICGHDHRGGYAQSPSGVHHITIAGMVEAPITSNAYAVLKVFPNKLVLDGLGTMVDSHPTLLLRRPLSDAQAQTLMCGTASTHTPATSHSKL